MWVVTPAFMPSKPSGAARVLGVDAQRHHVTQANFVRRALGLDLEFRRMSVYDLSPRNVGQFDLTLAPGFTLSLQAPGSGGGETGARH
jgi:tRNA (mo5U34)-methyltransferase